MNKILKYRACEINKNKTTLEFEIDLKKLISVITLNHNDAEREVLNNLNKFEHMEFLGLRDKNGQIIYFGDILTDEFNNLLTPVCEISHGEHILFFKPIKFLNKKIGIGCKSTYSNTLEVIGNIYKNSQLFSGLKAKNILTKLIRTSKNSEILTTTLKTVSYTHLTLPTILRV